MVVEVLRALGRRWYIVVVGLLTTAGLVYGAYVATPPEYNARALALLLPSEEAVGEGGNPLLTLGGLEQPAGILVAYFSSSAARAEIEELSPTAEYIVGIDDSTRGPVIAVDVIDVSPESTMTVLNHLLERLPEELERLQNEVEAPPESAIGVMVLTADQEAHPDLSGTIRLMIVALVIGVVATGFLGYGFDSLMQRRSLRREQRAVSKAAETGPAHPGTQSPATKPPTSAQFSDGSDGAIVKVGTRRERRA